MTEDFDVFDTLPSLIERYPKMKIFKVPTGLFTEIYLKTRHGITHENLRKMPKGAYVICPEKQELANEFIKFLYENNKRKIYLADIHKDKIAFYRFMNYVQGGLILAIDDPENFISQAVFSSVEARDKEAQARVIKKKIDYETGRFTKRG